MINVSPVWPLRSLLFVPANRPEWVKKAIASGAHGVILDLEDSVPAAERAHARNLIAEQLAALRAAGVAGIVRINAIGEGADEDIAACVATGLDALLVPKLAEPKEIHEVHDRLSFAEGKAGLAHGSVGIIVLPETARGIQAAHELACASPRITGLMTCCIGPVSGDVTRAFGFEASDDGLEQIFLQSRCILASRAAGARYPLGAVFGTRIDDLVTVKKLVQRAKKMGFSGVAIMHPTHVAIANQVFEPSAEEIEYSRALIVALEEAHRLGVGATRFRGMMVDAAMLPLAQDIVAEATRRGRLAG